MGGEQHGPVEPLDMRKHGWGWGVSMSTKLGDGRHRILGHGHGLAVGVPIRLPQGGSHWSLFRVESVEYFRDPTDMFSAVVQWFAEGE